ncbi:MAG TPA: hypothetical protein VNA57_11230 [Acidimicrobiales bacterium]|nr:hypothetical protein [Acidimicrobiales bacterium]
MSLRLRTRSQLDELQQDRYRRVELRPGEPQAPRLARWLTDEGVVPGRWPAAICLSWIAVYAMAILLEPRPADPQAAEPLWAVFLFMTLIGVLAATCVGLARRQRLGLVASVAAAGLALGAAVMCPVSGHHGSTGAWWFLQMGGFASLMGLGLVGLTRSRSRSRAG